MSIAGARAFLLRKRQPKAVVSRKDRCPWCRSPSFGKSRCPPCLAVVAEANRVRRARLKDQGLCSDCQEPAKDGASRCEPCQDRRRVREREMKQQVPPSAAKENA